MKRKTLQKPVQSPEVPATAGMLSQMEDRLNHKFDSRFHELKSELHRVALLVEEQNARNKYVMDGYTQIYELLATKTR